MSLDPRNAGFSSPPRRGGKEGAGNRISELDALRGLAALSVVLFHYTTRYQQIYEHPSPPLFDWHMGFRGVDIFFMISGFVIFMTLQRVSTGMDFVVSRFSRLFPAYWTAVLVTFAVVWIAGLPGREVSFSDMLLNLTMVQEFLQVKSVDGAYWTLQVELFFYVIMLFLFHTRLLARIDRVLVAWLALRAIYVLAEWNAVHLPYRVGELLILSHIPLFGLGITFYRLHNHDGKPAVNLALLALCLATIALSGRIDAFLTALFGCAVFSLLLRRHLGFLSRPLFVFLGTISYSLYLLHENIGFTILRALYALDTSPDLAIPMAILVAVGLATVLTYTIEKPAMKYIRATYKSRRSSSAVVVRNRM